jgi:hypothetical protein
MPAHFARPELTTTILASSHHFFAAAQPADDACMLPLNPSLCQTFIAMRTPDHPASRLAGWCRFHRFYDEHKSKLVQEKNIRKYEKVFECIDCINALSAGTRGRRPPPIPPFLKKHAWPALGLISAAHKRSLRDLNHENVKRSATLFA